MTAPKRRSKPADAKPATRSAAAESPKKSAVAGLRRPRQERDWKSTFQLLVAMALAGAAMQAAARNALLKLFERWPDAASLSRADVKAVERVLRPLGQARQNAEAAILLASDLVARFGGEVPASAEEIASLPGVNGTVTNVVVRRAHGVVPGAPTNEAVSEDEEGAPNSRVDASRLPSDWVAALGPALDAIDLETTLSRVAAERATGAVFPPAADVFAAFHHTPFAKTRVLVLGQDPYPTPGLAHGLAFSVKRGVKLPQSLVNMFQELKDDFGCELPKDGYLVPWAHQGVLLLNALLTVRASEPGSHKLFGWRELTDEVIRALDAREEHVVFVFWGTQARAKAKLVVSGRHTIIEGAHPSPMSVKAFRGSRPYSKINAALSAHNQPEIDWALA
ncbi:MAG: uracil-DNA glycosylase [Polyangiaceae bacterium]